MRFYWNQQEPYEYGFANYIYKPDAKYLEPDFAHPGVEVAVGTYFSLA